MAEHAKAAFRADASLQIGSGHVMRCLTLADELRDRGWHCTFICREHEGHLQSLLQQHGHAVVLLPMAKSAPDLSAIAHTHWLGSTQAADAAETAGIVSALQPDLLVVDHYSLSAEWEMRLLPLVCTLLAIDDLADRPHACHLLLDQNAGRTPADYSALVPPACCVLAGAAYALLRSGFARLRERSLARRETPVLRRVLVFLGGVDNGNVTGRVLEALRGLQLPQPIAFSVVMGPTAPWAADVAQRAASLGGDIEVLNNVSDMATLMLGCDLAIGAAGSASWERCCLGLPALIAVLAENQRGAGAYLVQQGAARLLEMDADLPQVLQQQLADLQRNPDTLRRMSQSAAALVDGQGVQRVLAALDAVERLAQ